MRCVVLGDGRAVRLGAYVKAWRTVLGASPAAKFERSLCDRWSASRDEILAQFREGLHDRINRHIPGFGQGRKWDHDWQREAIQFAHAVNTPRLIVRWAPMHFRARLAHRLTAGGY